MLTPARGLRDAEIDETRAPRRIDEDVTRLDIAVNHALAKLRFRRCEKADDGREGRKCLFNRHFPSHATKLFREGVALEPLFDDAAFLAGTEGGRNAYSAACKRLGKHAEVRERLEGAPLELAFLAALERLHRDEHPAGRARLEDGCLPAAACNPLEHKTLRCLANVATKGKRRGEMQLGREVDAGRRRGRRARSGEKLLAHGRPPLHVGCSRPSSCAIMLRIA